MSIIFLNSAFAMLLLAFAELPAALLALLLLPLLLLLLLLVLPPAALRVNDEVRSPLSIVLNMLLNGSLGFDGDMIGAPLPVSFCVTFVFGALGEEIVEEVVVDVEELVTMFAGVGFGDVVSGENFAANASRRIKMRVKCLQIPRCIHTNTINIIISAKNS